MKRAAWMTTICFVLVTSIALAQSVDGNWTTSLRTREPDRQIITLTLKSEGSKVSGTIHAFQPIPLEGSMCMRRPGAAFTSTIAPPLCSSGSVTLAATTSTPA